MHDEICPDCGCEENFHTRDCRHLHDPDSRGPVAEVPVVRLWLANKLVREEQIRQNFLIADLDERLRAIDRPHDPSQRTYKEWGERARIVVDGYRRMLARLTGDEDWYGVRSLQADAEELMKEWPG